MLQKGIKIGPFDFIQMSETSELLGALPPGPHQVSLLSPNFKKRSMGPDLFE